VVLSRLPRDIKYIGFSIMYDFKTRSDYVELIQDAEKITFYGTPLKDLDKDDLLFTIGFIIKHKDVLGVLLCKKL
jgi:hypothetical protein